VSRGEIGQKRKHKIINWTEFLKEISFCDLLLSVLVEALRKYDFHAGNHARVGKFDNKVE
jgi:hypothetical protein